MIEIYTFSKPDEKIKGYAKEIFSLEKGVYNLPTSDNSKKDLFEKLYSLGVRQIIHDGKPNLIRCMDGHLFAELTVAGTDPESSDLLIISNPDNI